QHLGLAWSTALGCSAALQLATQMSIKGGTQATKFNSTHRSTSYGHTVQHHPDSPLVSPSLQEDDHVTTLAH
ncbi:hypothetical protein COO60DRAFT_1570661, partial [Scenedesmus sp. NREL 46B-D3]